MAVKTGDAITVSFTTQRFDTGAATNADSLPTGTLYVNGVSNAATVTVTNTTTGQYSAAVTLPTLAIGDRCEIAIAATVNSVAGRGIIWRDAYDVATDSSGRVTVGSNADKTGYSLTQSFPANFSSLAITAGGAVTAGTVNDKTGYSLTQSFPANFASLGINSSGDVSRVTLVDTTTTNTDMRGTDGAALASDWTATRAGYLDSVLIAANSNRTVQVTGSNHVAAVVHDAEPNSIPEDAFITGALSARALAADAGAEIADAVLTRGAANVETTAEAYSITDMLLGVFESKVETGTWTIYRTDGTTTHRTKTVTTDAGAQPITRVQ